MMYMYSKKERFGTGWSACQTFASDCGKASAVSLCQGVLWTPMPVLTSGRLFEGLRMTTHPLRHQEKPSGVCWTNMLLLPVKYESLYWHQLSKQLANVDNTLTSTDLHAQSIVSNMPYLLNQSRDSQFSGCHSKWPSLKAWFFPSAQASQLKRTYLYRHQSELKSKERQGCSMSKYEATKRQRMTFGNISFFLGLLWLYKCTSAPQLHRKFCPAPQRSI
jgi:hypothetical protein